MQDFKHTYGIIYNRILTLNCVPAWIKTSLRKLILTHQVSKFKSMEPK